MLCVRFPKSFYLKPPISDLLFVWKRFEIFVSAYPLSRLFSKLLMLLKNKSKHRKKEFHEQNKFVVGGASIPKDPRTWKTRCRNKFLSSVKRLLWMEATLDFHWIHHNFAFLQPRVVIQNEVKCVRHVNITHFSPALLLSSWLHSKITLGQFLFSWISLSSHHSHSVAHSVLLWDVNW